jgi:uncharacterized membrane protein
MRCCSAYASGFGPSYMTSSVAWTVLAPAGTVDHRRVVGQPSPKDSADGKDLADDDLRSSAVEGRATSLARPGISRAANPFLPSSACCGVRSVWFEAVRVVARRDVAVSRTGDSTMTDIDPSAEIAVLEADGQVTARIPLGGEITERWLQSYQGLARANRVPVRAELRPERAWLIVRIPDNGNYRDVTDTIESAQALIAEADQALKRGEVRTGAADNVRAWWAEMQTREPRRPTSKIEVVRTGIGAEKRWLLALALVAAMVVQLLLPPRFSLGPNWLVPAVEGLLLIAVLVADLTLTKQRSAIVRVLSSALVLVLVASAAFVTVRLVVDLIEGGPYTNSPSDLIAVGFGVWIYTILAFAFLYWLLDGGGPESRIWNPPEYPDLAFPEQLNPDVAPPGWRPEFADYLYLAFTDATAFSPTDVMPLARWGKLTMAIQAVVSLAIGGLVIARAVNILS